MLKKVVGIGGMTTPEIEARINGLEKEQKLPICINLSASMLVCQYSINVVPLLRLIDR